MDRRTFLGALVIPLTTAVRRAAAQQTHVARIAWLAIEPLPELLGAFRQSLQTLGYVEGRTAMVEEHYAGGQAERLADLAAELVRSKPDVIVAIGSASNLAVQRATTALPVVFVVGDPVATGLVKSLAHPGGNLTGLAIIAGELNGKRIELLKEAVPSVARLAVLGDANAPGTSSLSGLAELETAARKRGIEVVRPVDVRSEADFEAAFATAVKERTDGILVLSSPLFGALRHQIVTLAAKTKLPAIYEGRRFVEASGLISYGPNVADVLRLAAVYVDKILKGAKPADLPVERPTKFELVINLKTAKVLGLAIPQALLLRADEVIQ
jgi:putative ABC transport system substrate-binding protein